MTSETKRTANKAAEAMRVYLGSVDYAALRAQERFYRNVARLLARVAESTGLDSADAWRQTEDEARRRGIVRPMPAKNY